VVEVVVGEEEEQDVVMKMLEGEVEEVRHIHRLLQKSDLQNRRHHRH
jgi:hypothetical protein